MLMAIVGEDHGQYLLLSLRHGRVRLEISYGEGHVLSFETLQTYNSGSWVSVEAARALRGDADETGVLRVDFNGAKEDLMNTISLPREMGEFDLEKCRIFFGGLPPTQDASFMKGSKGLRGFLGSFRSITVSNPGSNSILNPLYSERHDYSPRYGVEPYCKDQVWKSSHKIM